MLFWPERAFIPTSGLFASESGKTSIVRVSLHVFAAIKPTRSSCKCSESNILHCQQNKSEEKLKRKFRISKMITFRLCMNIFGIRISVRYRDPVINNFRRYPKRRNAQNCSSTAVLTLLWDIDVHAILGDIYLRWVENFLSVCVYFLKFHDVVSLFLCFIYLLLLIYNS